MAVPKKKKSKSCTGKRKNANNAIKKINLTQNPDGEYVLPHIVSKKGVYNGKIVFVKKEKPLEVQE